MDKKTKLDEIIKKAEEDLNKKSPEEKNKLLNDKDIKDFGNRMKHESQDLDKKDD